MCLQAGGMRVQVVGTADQSGEHDHEGEVGVMIIKVRCEVGHPLGEVCDQ